MSPTAQAASESHDLTVEQLAERSGVTVRNIRAYQSRGLLDPPELRGRTGFYETAHLERLRLIRRLQKDGFNLAAIGRVLESSAQDDAHLQSLRSTVLRPFEPESPVCLDANALERALGDSAAVQRAVELGLIDEGDDGELRFRTPTLLEAGDELRRSGVPDEAVSAVATTLVEHADAIAQAFVDVVLTHVWEPYEAAGTPVDEWPRIQSLLERTGPLASRSLMAVFNQRMSDAIETAVARAMVRREDAGTAARVG